MGRKVSIKRLSRHGNSLMVVLPRPFLHAMNLLRGDYVELALDEENTDTSGRPIVRIRGLYPHSTQVAPPAKAQGIAEVG